ncbi:MAG: MMPL family transporter [Planctomycetaceae bacterium]
MSAEGNPLAETSLLAKPLEILTRFTLRSPVSVLWVVGGLGLVCILLTINGLGFKGSRLDLLNPQSTYNKRWLNYLAEFGDRDDAVVVVQSTDTKAVTKTIDDLANRIGQKPEVFDSLLYRQDLSTIQSKGLQLVAEQLSEQEFKQFADGLTQAAGALPWEVHRDPTEVLQKLNHTAAKEAKSDPRARAQLEENYTRLVQGLMPAVIPEQMKSPEVKAQMEQLLSPDGGLAEVQKIKPQMEQLQTKYFTSHQGRIGFLLVRFVDHSGESARGATALTELRKVIEEARKDFPEMWIGITGMPVIEQDEMQASQIDMIWTNVLSLLGVALLFISGFGGLRHAGLAVLVLLVGMMWSFGFVTLVVGHLNILSAAFGVILIGLGIDFSIHYVASYLRLRRRGMTCEQAVLETATDVGPGVLTGGITTAAAFFMAALTEFTGVRELGIVAGGGILLCVLATVIMLPPLILIVDRDRPVEELPQILPAAGWFKGLIAFPKLTVIAGIALTIALASGASKLYYDHNLLNLQPKHIESVDIERSLFTKSDDSVWFAVSMCKTRDELKARKEQLSKLDSIAKTEEVVSLLPQIEGEKLRALAALQAAVEPLAGQLQASAKVREFSTEDFEKELVRAQRLLQGMERPNLRLIGTIDQMLRMLAQYSFEEASQRLTGHRELMLEKVAKPLAELVPYANATPIKLSDLPQPLADRFVGKNSVHLLKVYAKGDIWDMESLERFVRDVEGVDPQITGHPIQTFYASQHMQQSYIQAGLYALVAVAVLIFIDFRSIGYTLLAMLPLAVGFAQLCGAIGWLNIPFNPANMIVLPLILGIGVDDGVHLVHEFRRQRGRFRLTDSTATAVILTSTTTMASFGSMILARHQGLRSLGQVLCLGVLACLFCSIALFPALLTWLTQHREVTEESEEEQPLASAAPATSASASG